MRKIRGDWGAAALALCAAYTCAWDAQAMSPGELGPQQGTESAFTFGGGYGYYAQDTALRLSVGFHFRKYDAFMGKSGTIFGRDAVAPFSLDVVFPFHLTVTDAGMPDPFWRRSEYNELSEFAGILQRLEYGRPDGPLYFRLGKLSDIRVGHGTMLDRYAADLFYDQTRTGAYLSLLAPSAGAQVFVDDLFAPSAIVSRGYWSPWAHHARARRGLAFGVSFGLDPSVPQRAESLDTIPAPSTAADDKFNVPRSAFPMRDPFLTWGLDVEFAVVNSERVSTTLYGDVVFQRSSELELQTGAHLGAVLGWQVTDRTVLELQAEYIPSSSGYLPVVLGRMYELQRIHRVSAPGRGVADAISLWGAPPTTDETGAVHSYRTLLGVHHAAVGSFRLGIDGGSRVADGHFFLKVTSPEGRRLRVGARYESTWQGKHFMEGAAIAAEAQVAITQGLLVWADGGRRWRFDEGWAALPHWHLMLGATFWLGIGR